MALSPSQGYSNSVLQATSANNYGSIRGQVITGKDVVSNSNSERGYRDDRILVSGNLQQSETSAGSRVAHSVRVVFDPFFWFG